MWYYQVPACVAVARAWVLEGFLLKTSPDEDAAEERSTSEEEEYEEQKSGGDVESVPSHKILPCAVKVHVPGAISSTAYGAAVAVSILACAYKLKLQSSIALSGEINKAGVLLDSVMYHPSITTFLADCSIEKLVVGVRNELDLGANVKILEGAADVLGALTLMIDEAQTKQGDYDHFSAISPL